MSVDLTFEFVIPKTALLQGGGDRIVAEEVRSAVEAATLTFAAEVIPRTPVGATAVLRGGVQTEVVGSGVDVVGRVFNPVSYAAPVETGSRPHFPPVGPLRLWVQRKLGVSEAESRSVAFLVARAISRRGTKAREMFKQAGVAARGRIEGIFDAMNQRIAQRLNGGS